MSGLDETDLDRLADYAAGVLDHTEARQVARLIAEDPVWAQAHAELHAAQPALDAALAGLSAAAVPADVAERLDRALSAAGGTGLGGGSAGGAGAGRTTVIRLDRRRRRTRMVAGLAAAAAAVVLGYGGITALTSLPGGTSMSSSGRSNSLRATGSGAGQLAPSAPDLSGGTGVFISASGTDYTHATLGQAGRQPDGRRPEAAAGGAAAGTSVPAALDRLLDPGQRAGCLAAIEEVHGGTPTALDFARYQGQPALIVVLAGGNASVVAVRPDCGLPGAGPAEIDHLST